LDGDFVAAPLTTACPACGKPLAIGARFCMSCGAAVGTISDAATVPPGSFERQSQEMAQAELQSLLVQATLGEFEILGELGRGGMATVFLAHDLTLDRKVAIKVVASHLLSSAGALERFKREARTAAALSHPHIIAIHSVRETERLLYFVMKYVQGRSLDSIIKEEGQLPIKMVTTIVAEVGRALAHAHKKGVVHRDIKPANIMIDEDGWAVVADFGIAKVADSQTMLTVSGSMVGTPFYMSPEQCSGKPVSGASDQYSLGVVAYEMLTGTRPFAGDTIMEIMKGHFFEAPAPIEAVRLDCPVELTDAIGRMMAKGADERWPTMDEMVAAIETAPLPHDDPIRSQMVSLAKSGENFQRFAKLSVPVSPIPRGTRGTAQRTRAATMPSHSAQRPATVELEQPELDAEPERRSRPWIWAVAGAVGTLMLAGGGFVAWQRSHQVVAGPASAGAAVATPILPSDSFAPAGNVAPVDSQAAVVPPPAQPVESAAVQAKPAESAADREERSRRAESNYHAEVQALIRQAWTAGHSGASAPPGARARLILLLSRGKAPTVDFPKSGEGDQALSDAAWDAMQSLTGSGRIPAIPAAYQGSFLRYLLEFTPSDVSITKD
jgi:serine/threonine protein kinase